jgi:exodeoxyribonuclease X
MKISEATWAIVDTETTGLHADKGDRIVEFGYAHLNGGREFDSFLVNPGIPIPCVTSAIHHITDEDVVLAIDWGAAMRMIPHQFAPETVFVAHNALFDYSFLPCLANRRWLCTKRLAKHLFPDAPGHSNQVLRYFFGGAKLDLGGIAPHRALADCIVTRFVFEKLIEKYLELGHEDSQNALIAFAAAPIAVYAIPFGKYKGRKLSDVPRDYVSWCLNTMTDLDPDLRIQMTAVFAGPQVPR